MATYGYVNTQTLQVGAPAILENIRPCNRRPQRVLHDNMSPIVTLRGIVNSPCNAGAQYKVSFSGNIAVAAGGTVGEIDLALSVEGYIYPLTIAAATPAAVGDFWHVSGDTNIDVPTGCCKTVTVVNASANTAIDVRNLNVEVDRKA